MAVDSIIGHWRKQVRGQRDPAKDLTKSDLSEPCDQKVCRQQKEREASAQAVCKCGVDVAFSRLLAEDLKKDEGTKGRNPHEKRQIKPPMGMIGWCGSEPQPTDHERFSQKHAEQRSSEKCGGQIECRPVSGRDKTGHSHPPVMLV
jgi:hypothetical protein